MRVAGRDPLFTADDAAGAVAGIVAPSLRGADLAAGFRAPTSPS